MLFLLGWDRFEQSSPTMMIDAADQGELATAREACLSIIMFSVA